MLPPPASNDLTSTPKKVARLSQTKLAIDQAHALEKALSPVADDDRDEIASNTSVAVSLSIYIFFYVSIISFVSFRAYSNI